MKTDQEIRERKFELQGAVDAIRKAPEDNQGRVAVSKEAVEEFLATGVGALDELERLRKVLGPSQLEKVETLVDGMADE